MALEKELETYKTHLPDLSLYEGYFVTISGSDIIGKYETYEAALAAGYAACGLDRPFMVKQIATQEQAHLITRNIAIACL